MSPDLEDRLRGLNPAAPENLKAAAISGAAEEPLEPDGLGTHWVQLVGAVAVVLVLVVVLLNVSAAPEHNVFSNISPGLGT